jgi:hypothetical protein
MNYYILIELNDVDSTFISLDAEGVLHYFEIFQLENIEILNATNQIIEALNQQEALLKFRQNLNLDLRKRTSKTFYEKTLRI